MVVIVVAVVFAVVVVLVASFSGVTCSIRSTPDEGGQHLDRGLLVGLLLQASLDLHPHAFLHLQQLGLAQPELSHGLLNLARLLRQTVRHRRHHGCAFRAATLGQEEADV